MTERKMLMELVKKITDNRGDLSQTDFVNFLIDNLCALESLHRNELA